MTMTDDEIKALPKPLRRRMCLEEMRKTINQIGPWSINKSNLARKYHFQRWTIDKWFRHLMKDIPPERIEVITNMGMATIQRSLSTCERIIANKDSSSMSKLKAVEKMNDTLKLMAPYMEAFNLKGKVAEEHIVVTANLDLNRVLEIARLKAERIKKAQEELR
jgi:hypothetical protein